MEVELDRRFTNTDYNRLSPLLLFPVVCMGSLDLDY